MDPEPDGGPIEWPESGWPKHWTILLATFVVLIVLILAYAIMAQSPFGGEPVETPAATTPAGGPG